MKEKLLQVGDKIKVSTGLMPPYISTIFRVTKTKAVGDYNGKKTPRVEFKRKYYDPTSIRDYSSQKWDTVRRELITTNL